MRAHSTGALLRLGLGAARRQGWLLVPLTLAQVAARLLLLLAAIHAFVAVLARAMQLPTGVPALSMAFGALDVLTHPAQLAIIVGASVLAWAGGWLVKLPANAGASLLLARQAGREEPVDHAAFEEGLLAAPERWLSAAGLALVLRLVAFVAALGAVIAGMAYFVANPGVLAALVMTVATCMVVLLPTLAAALDLGFVRAVLFDEGPVAALGNALFVARRHASQLVPAWFLFVVAELVVAAVAAVLDGLFAALPQSDGRWVLLLGPRALVWLLAAFSLAIVGLARLGTFVALVADDAGMVPPAPLPPPLPPPPPSGEVVLEAIAVAPAVQVSPTEQGVSDEAPSAGDAPADEG